MNGHGAIAFVLQAIAYEDGDIDKLLEETAKIGFQEPGSEEELTKLKADLGPGLEKVVVRMWHDEKEMDVEAVDDGEP